MSIAADASARRRRADICFHKETYRYVIYLTEQINYSVIIKLLPVSGRKS
jgi:hypothetical protein